MSSTPLVRLFLEAFPDPSAFPSDCYVREALNWDYGYRRHAESLEVIEREGSWPDVVSLVRERHPAHRVHTQGTETNLHSLLVECGAFAWASDIGKLGVPRFVLGEGKPDLRTDKGWWVEVKGARTSKQDQAADRLARAVSPIGFRSVDADRHPDHGTGPLRKISIEFDDAVRKWSAVPDPGPLVFFVELFGFDLAVWFREDEIKANIARWAIQAAKSTLGVRIVVCSSLEWKTPFVDVGHR